MNNSQNKKSQLIRVLVLKKTKLSENDLILSFLTEQGALLRAVAKGARKPSSTFSSRLELFCICDILIAKGKNLDIVKDARLINSFPKIRGNIDKLSAATPALEFMDKACQANLDQDNIYALTVAFLEQINATYEMHDTYLKALICAYLIKASSLLGFKPSFSSCVVCGKNTENLIGKYDFLVPFSLNNGGVVCIRCSKDLETRSEMSSVLFLMCNLLNKKFSDILLFSIDKQQVNQAINFCNNWIIYCLGIKLKSLSLYCKVGIQG